MARSTHRHAVANTNKGGTDAFVAKFDPQGALLWVTQFGSTGDDSVEGIIPPQQYTAPLPLCSGLDEGEHARRPSERTEYASAGGVDLFVAEIQLDNGAIRWVRQFGTAGDDIAYGLVTDRSAMIYVVGSTTGRLDGVTEPGAIQRCLHHATQLLRGLDGCPSTSSTSHRPRWTPLPTPWPSNLEDYPYLFVTGRVQGNEEGSLFVAKFDTYLNPPGDLGPGVVTMGGRNKGSDSDTGWAIAVDQSGNVIVAGSTLGAFEGNASAGGEDIVVVKLTSRLATVWTHQYGTDADDAAHGVAVDAEGSIYVTGSHGLPQRPGP